MELVAVITVLAVFQYAIFSLMVGLARGRFEVAAPATTGHPEFERYFRVQQNTLERLVIFVPSLWVFSYFVSPVVGVGLGLLFIIARTLYCIGYIKAANKRSLGYGLGELANTALMLGTLGGLVYQYFM